MKRIKSPETIELFASTCTSCRLCMNDCTLFQMSELTPQLIAERLLAGEWSQELKDIVQCCSLCGLCSQSCPLQLNPAELIQEARNRLVQVDAIEANEYRLMLVDEQDHFFNLYRETWNVSYRDLEENAASVLFFPGCTLSSYAPELTRAVWNWLSSIQGLNVGFSADCCGLPLVNIGLEDRAEAYMSQLENKLLKGGVSQVVTACPNCFYYLRSQLKEIEVVSLYQRLAESGVKTSRQGTVSVHDSCPDRFSGEIGRALRDLLPDQALLELSYHGAKTRCCGAGGIVSMINPQVSDERAQSRIAEIQENDADSCVSACMGCVKRLSAAGKYCDSHNSETRKIKHVLEGIFNCQLDHDEIDRRLTLMWQGEHGERNMARLNAAAQTENEGTARKAS